MRASRATLERYKTDGIFACRLAGAGTLNRSCEDFLEIDKVLASIYFLVLMATARVRPLLRRLSGPSCGGLARLFRWPSGKSYVRKLCLKFLIFKKDSSYGSLIKQELIPAISYLRSTYPLRVNLFFPSIFLEVFSVDKELDCTNLLSTDLFFDSINLYKYSFSTLFFFLNSLNYL